MTGFLDTYALIQIAGGRPVFKALAADAVTGHANLLEFHYHVSRRQNERVASQFLSRYWSLAVPATREDVADASHLRLRESSRRLSFIDALGYAMARNRRLTFVTGDPGVNGMPDVEMPDAVLRRSPPRRRDR